MVEVHKCGPVCAVDAFIASTRIIEDVGEGQLNPNNLRSKYLENTGYMNKLNEFHNFACTVVPP